MTLSARPATRDDLSAIAALQAAYDTHWFGEPENDLAEVTQSFDRAKDSLLVLEGDRLVAAAWWASEHETTLLVDPAASSPPYAALLTWCAEAGVEVDALARDEALLAALGPAGFAYLRSNYELLRDAEGLEQPSWPAGVRVTSLDDHAEAAWHLVYSRCGWLDVPGHGFRDYDGWRGVFLTPEVLPEQQVLAWVGDDLAGVAIGKTFSDGSGWVAQLAVADEHKGRGLGRALMLEAFRRRVEAGAVRVGLGVSADNPDALRLYLSVGLVIDREWRRYAHP